MSDRDFPSNLRECDPDQGGCSTLFASDLKACPHCQREVTVESEEDNTEEAPVTVTKSDSKPPKDAPPLTTGK
jgi:hypothetical protein